MGKHGKKQSPKKAEGIKKIPLSVKNTLNPLVKDLLNKCSSINIPKKLEWEHYEEIYTLLQRIRCIEKDYMFPLPKREENWNSFNSWCSEHGAVSNGIKIKEIQDGNYGMIAEKDLKEDDVLLTVPRKLMISTSSARESKMGPLIAKDPILQHMPNVVLSLYLLLELTDKNSFWKPYLSILPATYNTVLYFDLEEIRYLEGSCVKEEVLTICRSVARQYAYFHQLFQSDPYAQTLDIGHYFTYDLYRWAVSTVMTRQNSIPSPDEQSQLTALIPLWDMFNHANGKFSSEFSLEKDSLVSAAMRPYCEGDEVFIFYGPRTNAEFFVHNGFVCPYNDHDVVLIKFGLSKGDRLFSLKSELCEKQSLPVSGTYKLYADRIDESLMKFLKISIMKEDELKMELNAEMTQNDEKDGNLDNHALTFLKIRLTLLLNCHRFLDKEQDNLQPAESPKCLITQLCLEEKRILKHVYDYCCQKLQSVDVK